MTLIFPSDFDIERQFLQFLRDNHIEPVGSFSLVIDGNIHRYKLDGDKSGERSGAYCIFTNRDWPIGWAMDWHVKHSLQWHYISDDSQLSQEQRAYFLSDEYKAKIEREKIEREQKIKLKQAKAADAARARIDSLSDAPEYHPYLQRKNVFPYGVKLDDDKLAIPLRNINGLVQSLQWILPTGEKRFYPDAPLDGLFWSVGLDTVLPLDDHAVILLGEGFATMAKVYELTGIPSVAGISCYYLKRVAQVLKEKYPKARIIALADNDLATERKRDFNPGIQHAKELVLLGLAVDIVFPHFHNPDEGSDWDDFSLLWGDDYTANVLNSRIQYAIIPPEVKIVIDKTTSINAQDLRKKVFPPVKWAVQGFLPEGLSILAGGPKVGKSILALHLSVGVAIGGCVLGKIQVEKGQVLYLALEDTQRRLQDRINGGELASDWNVDLSALDIVTEIPRQNLGGSLFLQFWLEAHKNSRLVIIDTLQMFRKLLTGKGSMYSEDYETVSALKKIADSFHVPILIIHHLKKGMEGDWLSEISGSQGIAGAADTIFSLKRERNSSIATLHRTGRDVEEKDFILKLDGFGWVLQGEADEFTLPEWKRQILDFLKEHQSVTPIQLSEVTSISLSAAQQNLRRLMKEGLIRKTGYGTYGLPEE